MIDLLILDVDGVLTDGRKYYDREGTVRFKTFCDRDWTAIKRFRALGIKVIFLTGDPFNVTIGENRNLDVFVNRQNGAHNDKSSYLSEICATYSVIPDNVAFVGDDIFDIGLMKKVRYKYCPANAPLEVRNLCTVLNKNSGDNVVAELFDFLLITEGLPRYDFDQHLKNVYELDLKEKF
jgi:YrbI family 3-deoxy-D-manno-octulosonate 8-phosphate phosphatase